MTKPKTRVKPPRYGKLDGKPPSLPRGRNAKNAKASRRTGEPPTIVIPANQRIGFRVVEWAALTGQSYVSVWRGIKSGAIEIVDQNGIKFVPRAYAIRKGFITPDDKL